MQVISKLNLKKLSFLEKSNNLFVTVILFALCFPSALLAANYHKNDQNISFSQKNKYQPYLEIGGAKYFRQSSTAATVYDLFIPLLQKDDQLLFTDLRIFDRSGSQFEGNAHFGYRKLYPSTEQMFGIYGAFDRKRTIEQNHFNQLTFGFEYWHEHLFIGGNVYKPIGLTKKPIKTSQEIGLPELNISEETTKVQITTTKNYEKSIGGMDAELGYEITDRLTGYAGGYYFAASEVKTVAGPKIRFTYDYTKSNKRLFGILDGVKIEAQAQYDKPRRFSGYIGIKFKIGLTGNSNLQGFSTWTLTKTDPLMLKKIDPPDAHHIY